MNSAQKIRGVYAAVVTPLHEDFSIDLAAFPQLITFLAQRGCHGILLFGTTGEGPSFSAEERLCAFQVAARIRQELPGLGMLAGTGTPSLEETIRLTKAAFDFGFDGAVVLPPYYYRKTTEEGLFDWFRLVIQKAVPAGGALLGYHIPGVSGVALSIDLLARLKDTFPRQFAGLKDSSGEAEFARQLDQRFGQDLVVMNGNDRLLGQALGWHASGCITAMANLYSPILRQVWDAFHAGQPDPAAQTRIGKLRDVFDQHPPNPATVKGLMPHLHTLPSWPVRPPLVPHAPEVVKKMLAELAVLE
jgi:4-hydroxy-tetrahydrodipicolinate synthase